MSTQPKPPLWRELNAAAWMHVPPIGRGPDAVDSIKQARAAEIRALADWLVPEYPEPPTSEYFPALGSYSDRRWLQWRWDQKLRHLLITEADRAEEVE